MQAGNMLCRAIFVRTRIFMGLFLVGWPFRDPRRRTLWKFCRALWWKLDKALDAESIKYSALACLVDAQIWHDHPGPSRLPNCIDGSLDIIEEAVEAAGVRTSLCYEVTDRDGKERALAGIREKMSVLSKKSVGGEASPRISGSLGCMPA